MIADQRNKKAGGLTTISPPAKVNNAKVKPVCFEQILVLANGIDTLDLAIDVSWQSNEFLEYLEDIKGIAVKESKPLTVFLDYNQPGQESPFTIFNHGTEGYRWLLSNGQYFLKIGNWIQPKKKGRPSICATIRSETLWLLGLAGAVNQLQELIAKAGGKIVKVKCSRVDPCVDILLPEQVWDNSIAKYRVCRARKLSEHFENDILTGLSIGQGQICARLYDKPLEIRTQSPHKEWLYGIWGIDPDGIPEGHRIIRVEFQLRRTALKELGIDLISDLYNKSENLWAYCSRKWLKFRDRPGNHHTMRKTFQWWKAVQNGFPGAQTAHPLIREPAFKAQEKQLFYQAKGCLTSLHAVKTEFQDSPLNRTSDLNDVIKSFKEECIVNGLTDDQIHDEVFHKRSKYHRFLNMQQRVTKERS